MGIQHRGAKLYYRQETGVLELCFDHAATKVILLAEWEEGGLFDLVHGLFRLCCDAKMVPCAITHCHELTRRFVDPVKV